jgi:hypothetical protein
VGCRGDATAAAAAATIISLLHSPLLVRPGCTSPILLGRSGCSYRWSKEGANRLLPSAIIFHTLALRHARRTIKARGVASEFPLPSAGPLGALIVF